MPADTGDLLYIEDTNGRVYGINTAASAFELIIREAPEEEVEDENDKR